MDSTQRQKIYLAVGEFSCQKDKAEEFAKGMEACMAKFYRSQPGVHAYLVGVGVQEPDTVLLTMVASNKELFNSLPKFSEDLDKLNQARGPFLGLLKGSPGESRRFVDTEYTVGDASMLQHLPPAVPDDATVRWEDTMGNDLDPSQTPKHSQYIAVAEYRTQPGKAEEVAKGFDATQGAFYRKIPECLLYLHGVKDSETVLSVTVWTSQEVFESQPSNADLDQARDPYRALLVGPTFRDSVRYRDTGYLVGDKLSKS